MLRFGKNPSEQTEDAWRQKLAQFAKENQRELAALAWGLRSQRGETDDTLGIDLQPVPHFVYCPKKAIEELNRQVGNHLQEILGVVENHNPEKEVLIVGIGDGQLKLIQFETDPTPPVCFEQVAADVDTLLDRLEQRLAEQMQVTIEAD